VTLLVMSSATASLSAIIFWCASSAACVPFRQHRSKAFLEMKEATGLGCRDVQALHNVCCDMHNQCKPHVVVSGQRYLVQDGRATQLDVRVVDAHPEAVAHDLQPGQQKLYVCTL